MLNDLVAEEKPKAKPAKRNLLKDVYDEVSKDALAFASHLPLGPGMLSKAALGDMPESERQTRTLRAGAAIYSLPAAELGATTGAGLATGLLAKGIEAGKFAPEGVSLLSKLIGGPLAGIASTATINKVTGETGSIPQYVTNAALGLAPGLGGRESIVNSLEDVGKIPSAAAIATDTGKLTVPSFPTKPEEIPKELIDRVITGLKGVKKVRPEQLAGYSAERGSRMAEALKAASSFEGEDYAKVLFSKMQGELPQPKFTKPVLAPEDVSQLYSVIKHSSRITDYEKLSAFNAMTKLFADNQQIIPGDYEIGLLNDVFGNRFAREVMRMKRGGFWHHVIEAANIPRALVSSMDLSAPLRQGAFLIGRPKQYFPAFAKMFKYFGSEKAYQGLYDDIAARPTFDLMKQNKLAITQAGSVNKNEEAFLHSQWIEKVPGIRASNRAYSGFLTKLRADTFDHLVSKLGTQHADAIADYVNTATGRGGLGRWERSADVLNNVFFSPRLWSSRLKLFSPYSARYYAQLPAPVRKEAAKDLVKTMVAANTVLALASRVPGVKVGLDPRSSDFGKIRYKNTRWDVFAGFQQSTRVLSQQVAGEYKSSTTGEVRKFGEPGGQTRLEALARYASGKEAPALRFVATLLSGKGSDLGKLNVPVELYKSLTPIMIQDLIDAAQQYGYDSPMVPAIGVPSVFGVSTQTYADKESPLGLQQAAARAVKKRDKKLLMEIRGIIREQQKRRSQ